MWVSIDFCLIPIGVSVSLAPYILACRNTIEKCGLDYELGPNGTAIEGDWEEVFKCIKYCHEEIHLLGAKRIYSTIKINTRTDKKQSFRDKLPSLISKLD